jgi:hypothetical protein
MSKNQSPKKFNCAAFGMGLGLLFGGFLGLLAGNLVLFAGGGMILGLGIGLSINSSCKGIFF